jgi:hypothetical protein
VPASIAPQRPKPGHAPRKELEGAIMIGILIVAHGTLGDSPPAQ